jgi:carbon storage regulator CsrA
MLVLSRKVGERILIGDNVVVQLLEARRGQVRLGITAPPAISIRRQELLGQAERGRRLQPVTANSPPLAAVRARRRRLGDAAVFHRRDTFPEPSPPAPPARQGRRRHETLAGGASRVPGPEEACPMPPHASACPTLLVVEDDDVAREALAAVLRRAGYRVLPAANGEEALAALRADPAPDLILLDMLMPVLDG